ncbi:MAG TPA: DUF4466 family protein [Puia sp.]|nr:DUF4466 family protein [Puia sp.]
MRHLSKYSGFVFLLAAAPLFFTGSCKKNNYALPNLPNKLQNEAIKRTLGPNIVGQQIEFAYAMAIKPNFGKLVSCLAEASIPGAPGTFMENRSFYTAQTGADVGITVGTPSVTVGTATTVTYNRDTSAATLRYYYVIPEAARGKTVTFRFTATSSDGEKISTLMGPYTITKMDMKLNLKLSDNNLMYISIGDTAVYNAADAAAHAASIDLVYLYRNLTTSAFNHALVAPAADPQYLPGVTLPAGVNRTAKLLKEFNMQDHNLAPGLQYGTLFIDDVDFQKLDLTGDPNFAINLKQEAGVWVETADGKYRAYIFMNTVAAAGTATISMKRYALK